VGLYFMWYNFGRIHQTLKMTPAMKAGIAARPWTVEEILALTAGWDSKLTHYQKSGPVSVLVTT
jgi:hypothetical protein